MLISAEPAGLYAANFTEGTLEPSWPRRFDRTGVTERKGKNGAGGGNRTRVTSLEGWSFTTKQHPQREYLLMR
jgi:hypothetical protein